MRDSETRPLVDGRTFSEPDGSRFHAVAAWGSYVVIAAVLFGTLAYRPF